VRRIWLREPASGNEHPIEPRLLDIVYRIQMHFSAQEIRVISGYRTPAAIASGHGSNHGRGRAIDVVVPGATDEDVAKLVREMGFMGVGIYPVSGFVHVDVRDRSYFWIDTSGPGGKIGSAESSLTWRPGRTAMRPRAPSGDCLRRSSVRTSTPSSGVSAPASSDRPRVGSRKTKTSRG